MNQNSEYDFQIEVQHALVDARMNKKQLCKLIGKSRSTVDRWIREPWNVQTQDMILLLEAVKYTPEEAKETYSRIIDQRWKR